MRAPAGLAADAPRPVLELLGRAVMDKNRAQREARQLRAELAAALERDGHPEWKATR